MNTKILTKDKHIISHLRHSGRKKITDIAHELNIPATTVYDRVRIHSENGVILKHITHLNFPKLGFHSHSIVVMNPKPEDMTPVYEYLTEHPNVNSLVKTTSSFIAETIFTDLSSTYAFVEQARCKFNAQIQLFPIIQEIKRESFLSIPEHFDLI